MFFHIVNKQDLKLHFDLLSAFEIDGIFIQLDQGWSQEETDSIISFTKGYSIESAMDDLDVHEPTTGNYCSIQYNKPTKTLNIYYDDIRGFPIYIGAGIVSNLKPSNDKLGYHEEVSMTNKVIYVTLYDAARFISRDPLPLDVITDLAEANLLDYIKGYKQFNDFELTINPTCGADSTTLMAIMNYHNIPYIETELVQTWDGGNPWSSEPLFTYIGENNWGYAQLRVTPEPQVLITGFWGDEYLMRGPKYVHHYLKGFDINLCDEAIKTNCYMQEFIVERYIGKFVEISYDAQQLASALLCDYQMWSVNNTITLVPYKNMAMLELSFRLSPEDALDQALRARIQHNIISKCSPELLSTIAHSKNGR